MQGTDIHTKVSTSTSSTGPALKIQHHGALWGSSCLQDASVQLDRVEIEGDGTITPAGFISHSIVRSSGVVLPTRSGRSGGCDADELFEASLLYRVSTEGPLSVLCQSMGWKRVVQGAGGVIAI